MRLPTMRAHCSFDLDPHPMWRGRAVPRTAASEVWPAGKDGEGCTPVSLPPDTMLTPVDGMQYTKEYGEKVRLPPGKYCTPDGKKCIQSWNAFMQKLTCQYRLPDGQIVTGVSSSQNVPGMASMHDNVCPGYELVKGPDGHRPVAVPVSAGVFERIYKCDT